MTQIDPNSSNAQAEAERDWVRPNDATFRNFFAHSLHEASTVAEQRPAAEALARYDLGGGNTPYVFGDWKAEASDPVFRQWWNFHGGNGGNVYLPGPDAEVSDSSGVPRGKVSNS